jgi:hypothetical protein
MRDAFADLLHKPSAMRYKRVRALWLHEQHASDFSATLAELAQRLEHELRSERARSEAAQLVAALQPCGWLCLRWHRLAGQLALLCGEQERARLHRFAFAGIQAGILATGNGSRARPWLIADGSDACEILLCTGREPKSHMLVQDAGRFCDVWLADNEHEFWFDSTDRVIRSVPAPLPQPVPKSPRAAAVVPRRKKVSRSRR